MGLFSNNASTEFKIKFTDTLNLISGYSFGTLRTSDEVSEMKIKVQFLELIEIARRINNPYNEYFTFYLSSVFGEKLSIAEGLLIVSRSIELASHQERITQSVSESLILYARSEVKNSFGQSKVREIINSK